MGMERGGRADKLGNEYERLWVVYQLLRLLRNDAAAVTWEPAGHDADGVDVRVELLDGTLSLESCKRENASEGKWTLTHLKGRGVLAAAKLQLAAGSMRRFVFVSRDPCPELRDLAERASRYDGDVDIYYRDLSPKLQGSFDYLVEHWSLAAEPAPGDRDTVFQMLTACEAKAFDLTLLGDYVHTLAQSAVDAAPDITRTLLADFAVRNLGTRLVRADIEGCLRSQKLILRSDTSDGSVAAAISSLQASFCDSIKPYLINEQLIHREEANKLIDTVTSDKHERPRLVMVHGRPGIGKSGVLFGLVEILQDRNIPFLPVRLDRRIPVGSADRFGREECGLSSSPARALESIAGDKRAVLILDQIDALRWTAAHTDRPMDVLTEIVREALNPLCLTDITVVVVCRTFDLEDDPRIAHLKSIAKSLMIEIGLLTPDATREIVNAERDRWTSLSEAQRRLLQEPQTLCLWTRLRSSVGHAPIFRTHTDLMRAFWEDIFQRQRPQSIEAKDLQQILDKFVERMDHTGRLTAPVSLIASSGADAVRFLRSSGVIRIDDRNQCIFTHQSYFDFLIADSLNRELLNGNTTLPDWLKASEQSLFRRDQLRQVLSLQRDDNAGEYLAAIESILGDSQIRFHLKHLVIRFLSLTESPMSGEIALIVRLLGEEEWRERVFGQVLWNKPSWFTALDTQGLWVKWLDSGDESLISMALRMVGIMSRHCGERAVAILGSYVDADEPWPGRVAEALAWGDIDEASVAVFDLYVKVFHKGLQPIRHLWWGRLAKKHPERCLRLLTLRLQLLVQSGNNLREGRSDELAAIGIMPPKRQDEESLREAAAKCPSLTWELISQICLPLERLCRWASRNRDWAVYDSPISQLSDQCRNSLKQSTQLLAVAGESLAQSCPDAFKDFVSKWETKPRTSLIERALLCSMIALADDDADYVCEWLLAKRRRLELGDSSELVSKQESTRVLVERFGRYFSDAVIVKLEKAFLDYKASDLKRMLKYDHENAKNGHYYPNHYGKAQYILLSAIPRERLSDHGQGQYEMWKRKFGKPPSGRRTQGIGGSVGSTIPSDRLHLITDAHWLRIAAGDWSERKHEYLSRKVMGEGRLGEATHEQFANVVGAMARRQPARFAELAMALPETSPQKYFREILRAFDEKEPPSVLTKAAEQNKDNPERVAVLQQELKSWRAATREEIEAIIEKIGFPEDLETAKDVCWLISKRDDISWSQSTIDLIARLATSHPCPAPDYFASHSQDSADRGKMIPDIADSGLNCVRGSAASTIRDILFADKSPYGSLKNSIIALTQDVNIAVRSAAIATCTPILNIDRDEAIGHFLSICATGDDRVFESHYIDEFLSYALSTHSEQLLPIIERMANSKISGVAKNGAGWVAAVWLNEDRCEDLLDVCRTGSQPQRHGVSEVAGKSAWEIKTADRRIELLLDLFDDKDTDVRSDVSRLFWKEELWLDDRVIDLALRFINSQAFADDPTSIINGLGEIKGSVLKYADVIHAIADKFAGSLASDASDGGKHVHSNVPDLFKLLLRLYQQAQDGRRDEVQIASLDCWDSLLRAGVGDLHTAEQLLDSVDR